MTARSADSTFAIVANGFAEGPAQALCEHLRRRGARVVMVSHPLLAEQGRKHVVTTYDGERLMRSRGVWTPLRPVASYALDPLIPLGMPRVAAWFGFNPLACARGLLQRRLGWAGKVVLWSVDFSEDRFGAGTPLTRLYDALDRLCCRRADGRVELSAAARDARRARLGLDDARTPAFVVPMGAWLDRVPTVPTDGFRRRRAVYLGHLTQRQGVDALVEAIAVLRARGSDVTLDVIGGGSELAALQSLATARGVQDAVRFHGFVPDHRRVEMLLAEASVAVAPYVPSETTFTRYADPGKLKSYLGAGLPIVLTDVPPNARELADEAGAELVPYEASAIADAIEHGLASPERWSERRERALAYARRFDWPLLLDDVLEKLGIPIGVETTARDGAP
jgi:glycosyltransferase involved in cell wall biosynthesis